MPLYQVAGRWRMPTEAEFLELLNGSNCTWDWYSYATDKGYRVTSKVAGHTTQSIFLPGAGGYIDSPTASSRTGDYGYYWSATRSSSQAGHARILFYSKASAGEVAPETKDLVRHFGMPVRAVQTANRTNYSTLADLKTAVNNDDAIDFEDFFGWQVDASGNIGHSVASPIGYIAYISKSNVDNGVPGSRILVIAKDDVSGSFEWGSKGTLVGITSTTTLRGYSNTYTLQGISSGAHPAAEAAWNYTASLPGGCHWFLPCAYQMDCMMKAMGGYAAFKATVGLADSAYYASSSEYNNYDAWRLLYATGKMGHSGKEQHSHVRACFAY